MGEIDHADDAVDHGVTDGDQCIGAAQRDAVEHLLQKIENLLRHTRTLGCAV
ncbi:hypothetical protein D3C72_2542410 [compost metagenome]